MPRVATHPPTPAGDPVETGPDALRPRRGSRRRRLTVLTWVAVVALTGFLVAIASGLISDNDAAPTPLVAKKIPAAVERELRAGWGSQASVVGRYSVRIRMASGLTAYRPTTGQLTLFMRVVKTGEAPLQSGILAVQTPSGTQLSYLTSLINTGGVLEATINGGAFVGPAIGGFAAIRTANGIAGVASIAGVTRFEAQYTRFSTSPQP
jgi:hypothetical protein